MDSNNARILTKEEIEIYKKPVWIEEVAERIFKNDEYRTYGGWYLPFRKKTMSIFTSARLIKIQYVIKLEHMV